MMFSVIIPVYNAEKYLRPCLDSVLNQTETDWECVCVDDGSTDSSGRILDEYAERDARFRVAHQKNGGEGAARNTGLSTAKGAWITWLDADDLYHPLRLAEARRLIELEKPDLVRFRTYMGREGEDQLPAELEFDREYNVFEGSKAQVWGWRTLAPAGMVWTWVAKRELLSGLAFRSGMRVKVDSIFSGSLANRLDRVVQSESRAYFYRYIASSAIHAQRKAEDCIRLLQAVRELYLSQIPLKGKVAFEVYDSMVRWLRVHAESDILDWLLKRKGERNRSAEIHAAYNELKEFGLCNGACILRRHMRLAFRLWDKFDLMWPTVCVKRAAEAARKVLK